MSSQEDFIAILEFQSITIYLSDKEIASSRDAENLWSLRISYRLMASRNFPENLNFLKQIYCSSITSCEKHVFTHQNWLILLNPGSKVRNFNWRGKNRWDYNISTVFHVFQVIAEYNWVCGHASESPKNFRRQNWRMSLWQTAQSCNWSQVTVRRWGIRKIIGGLFTHFVVWAWHTVINHSGLYRRGIAIKWA